MDGENCIGLCGNGFCGEMEMLTGGWRELQWAFCVYGICGEMEMLTGGWRELQWALGVWDLC